LLNQLGDQRGLSTEAIGRHHDPLPSPADCSGVEEHELGRILTDTNPYDGVQKFKECSPSSR
jgi:hypothetical protein